MPNAFLFSLRIPKWNLGDYILRRELAKLMLRHGSVHGYRGDLPDEICADYLGDCGHELEMHDRYGMIRVAAAAIWSSGFRRRQKTFLVLGPGEGGSVLENPVRSYLVLAALGLGRLLGIEIVQLGRSVALCSGISKTHARLMSKLKSVNAVRDSRSRTNAESNGELVTGVIPDLAFLLEYKPPKQPQEGILFSFRRVYDCHLHSYDPGFLFVLNAVNQWRCRRGGTLRGAYQVSQDREGNEKLASLFGYSFPVKWEGASFPVDSLRELYGSSELVFSDRMHVLLLAMVSGAIPVAVVNPNNSQKITALFEDLGLSELVLEVTEATSEDRIATRLNLVYDQRGTLQHLLQRKCLEYRTTIITKFAEMF